MSKQTVTIGAAEAGKRLDIALSEYTGLSRHQVQKAIREGRVTVAGRQPSAKLICQMGDMIELTAVPKEAVPDVPDLPILYEDKDMLVIDKPADLAVHASESGRVQPTVAAFAAAHGVEDGDTERPGIVHRLDKDTSGVMVLAKHPHAKTFLQKQFKDRTVAKTYIALVRGRLDHDQAIIRLPIGRDRKTPVKRTVLSGGRAAVTEYRLIRAYPGASLVEIKLHTGRTHQIRVHFSHLGHPIIGDTLYGEAKRPAGLTRQFLHASQLELSTAKGVLVVVKSPLPTELQTFLLTLDNQV